MSGDGSTVYTPPPRRSSSNGVDGEIVQQVKEAGMTVRYPMLAEDNYGVLAVKMKIFMRAQGVWAAVESKPRKMGRGMVNLAVADSDDEPTLL